MLASLLSFIRIAVVIHLLVAWEREPLLWLHIKVLHTYEKNYIAML